MASAADVGPSINHSTPTGSQMPYSLLQYYHQYTSGPIHTNMLFHIVYSLHSRWLSFFFFGTCLSLHETYSSVNGRGRNVFCALRISRVIFPYFCRAKSGYFKGHRVNCVSLYVCTTNLDYLSVGVKLQMTSS